MAAAIIVVAILGFGVLLLAVASSEIERRHAMWEEFRHPPDSEVKDHEQP